MALLGRSSLIRRSSDNSPLLSNFDYFLLFGRFILIAINYLMIFWGWQSLFARTQFLMLVLILLYGLWAWFGPGLINFRITNITLTIVDIFLVSAAFHFLPQVIYPLFSLYFVGVIINILYGGIFTSIGLALLATAGFTIALLNRLNLEYSREFYYTIISFNAITWLFCIAGLKTNKSIQRVEHEKDESKKRLHRLESLSRIVKEIAGELKIEKLLLLINQKAAQLTGASAGGIILKELDGVFRIKTLKGLPKTLMETEIRPESGLLGKVLSAKKTIFDKNSHPADHLLDLNHYHTAIASPIWSKGEIMGLIFLLGNQHHDAFTKDDQIILETLGEHAAIAMVNARIFEHTTSLSLNDYLTGVGNVRFFYQQLEHALAIASRYQQQCSLMIVDSDSLKAINDQHGNSQGFLHIKQLAEILKSLIRDSDIIARYDRDMFMIILPQTGAEEAKSLGRRIQHTVFQSPFVCDNKTIETSVCIGIASFPEDVANGQELIATAEGSLHNAKRLGKNKIVVAARREAELNEN